MPDYNSKEIIERTSTSFPDGTPVKNTEGASGEISDATHGGMYESSWRNLDLNPQFERIPGAIHGRTAGRIAKGYLK